MDDNDDDVDIYDDLQPFDYDEQCRKLTMEVKDLLERTERFLAKIDELTAEKEKVVKENKVLQKNISILLKTAKQEIQRKEQLIGELRNRLGQLEAKIALMVSNPRETTRSTSPRLMSSIATQTDHVFSNPVFCELVCEGEHSVKVKREPRVSSDSEGLRSIRDRKVSENTKSKEMPTNEKLRSERELDKRRVRDEDKNEHYFRRHKIRAERYQTKRDRVSERRRQHRNRSSRSPKPRTRSRSPQHPTRSGSLKYRTRSRSPKHRIRSRSPKFKSRTRSPYEKGDPKFGPRAQGPQGLSSSFGSRFEPFLRRLSPQATAKSRPVIPPAAENRDKDQIEPKVVCGDGKPVGAQHSVANKQTEGKLEVCLETTAIENEGISDNVGGFVSPALSEVYHSSYEELPEQREEGEMSDLDTFEDSFEDPSNINTDQQLTLRNRQASQPTLKTLFTIRMEQKLQRETLEKVMAPYCDGTSMFHDHNRPETRQLPLIHSILKIEELQDISSDELLMVAFKPPAVREEITGPAVGECAESQIQMQNINNEGVRLPEYALVDEQGQSESNRETPSPFIPESIETQGKNLDDLSEIKETLRLLVEKLNDADEAPHKEQQETETRMQGVLVPKQISLEENALVPLPPEPKINQQNVCFVVDNDVVKKGKLDNVQTTISSNQDKEEGGTRTVPSESNAPVDLHMYFSQPITFSPFKENYKLTPLSSPPAQANASLSLLKHDQCHKTMDLQPPPPTHPSIIACELSKVGTQTDAVSAAAAMKNFSVQKPIKPLSPSDIVSPAIERATSDLVSPPENGQKELQSIDEAKCRTQFDISKYRIPKKNSANVQVKQGMRDATTKPRHGENTVVTVSDDAAVTATDTNNGTVYPACVGDSEKSTIGNVSLEPASREDTMKRTRDSVMLKRNSSDDTLQQISNDGKVKSTRKNVTDKPTNGGNVKQVIGSRSRSDSGKPTSGSVTAKLTGKAVKSENGKVLLGKRKHQGNGSQSSKKFIQSPKETGAKSGPSVKNSNRDNSKPHPKRDGVLVKLIDNKGVVVKPKNHSPVVTRRGLDSENMALKGAHESSTSKMGLQQSEKPRRRSDEKGKKTLPSSFKATSVSSSQHQTKKPSPASDKCSSVASAGKESTGSKDGRETSKTKTASSEDKSRHHYNLTKTSRRVQKIEDNIDVVVYQKDLGDQKEKMIGTGDKREEKNLKATKWGQNRAEGEMLEEQSAAEVSTRSTSPGHLQQTSVKMLPLKLQLSAVKTPSLPSVEKDCTAPGEELKSTEKCWPHHFPSAKSSPIRRDDCEQRSMAWIKEKVDLHNAEQPRNTTPQPKPTGGDIANFEIFKSLTERSTAHRLQNDLLLSDSEGDVTDYEPHQEDQRYELTADEETSNSGSDSAASDLVELLFST